MAYLSFYSKTFEAVLHTFSPEFLIGSHGRNQQLLNPTEVHKSLGTTYQILNSKYVPDTY